MYWFKHLSFRPLTYETPVVTYESISIKSYVCTGKMVQDNILIKLGKLCQDVKPSVCQTDCNRNLKTDKPNCLSEISKVIVHYLFVFFTNQSPLTSLIVLVF